MDHRPHELLGAWSRFDASGQGPYVLPGDEVLLKAKPRVFTEPATFAQWDRCESKRLHLSLLPQPFFGDPVRASIVVLLANPGLRAVDIRLEQAWPEWRAALVATLRGERAEHRYPHLLLDPEFHAHPGFDYFQSRLRDARDLVVRRLGLTADDGQALIARELAVIQAAPYRSPEWGISPNVHRALRSSQLARAFVHDVVLPRVRSGRALLVVARSAKWWDVSERSGVIIYRGPATRRAPLGLKSPAGPAILAQLLVAADARAASARIERGSPEESALPTSRVG